MGLPAEGKASLHNYIYLINIEFGNLNTYKLQFLFRILK